MTLHGRIYHSLGALSPPPQLRPAYLSVYIHDTDFNAQTESRRAAMLQLSDGLLHKLTKMLHEANPYVQTFVSIRA